MPDGVGAALTLELFDADVLADVERVTAALREPLGDLEGETVAEGDANPDAEPLKLLPPEPLALDVAGAEPEREELLHRVDEGVADGVVDGALEREGDAVADALRHSEDDDVRDGTPLVLLERLGLALKLAVCDGDDEVDREGAALRDGETEDDSDSTAVTVRRALGVLDSDGFPEAVLDELGEELPLRRADTLRSAVGETDADGVVLDEPLLLAAALPLRVELTLPVSDCRLLAVALDFGDREDESVTLDEPLLLVTPLALRVALPLRVPLTVALADRE